jgi:urea transport system ATP-binding protein
MSQTYGATAKYTDPAMGSPMLEVSDLNVYYGESHILRNVDMTVHPGKMVCLIGRNGVGKTTLLKTIMGLLKPRSGTIALAGTPILSQSPDQRARMGIGYVPQGREVIPRLTVKENLILGLEAIPDRKSKTQEIPEEIYDLFPVLKTMLR